ncbi:unnamed protein product [Closterium sp. Yama58-4]|nr:unnamed protein product [Closterium sp. Yama58-4]
MFTLKVHADVDANTQTSTGAAVSSYSDAVRRSINGATLNASSSTSPASDAETLTPGQRPGELEGEIREAEDPGAGDNARGDNNECIPFSSGNPKVESTRGVIHLYRNTAESPGSLQNLPPDRGVELCVLAVPTYMTGADFCQFTGALLGAIESMRIVRAGAMSIADVVTTWGVGAMERYMVLMRMKSQEAADGFFRQFNNKPFSSMEVRLLSPSLSSMEVLVTGSQEEAATPPAGLTELPSCPVCLERLDRHISGVLTTVCNHSFHSSCISKWTDSSCPVRAPPALCVLLLPCACSSCPVRALPALCVLLLPCACSSCPVRAPPALCVLLLPCACSSCPVRAPPALCVLLLPCACSSCPVRAPPALCVLLLPCACSSCPVRAPPALCVLLLPCACSSCPVRAPPALYQGGHAESHFRASQHCYSLEVASQRVWDYVGDAFVHRLVLSKTDGKLVELPAPGDLGAGGRGGGAGGGEGGGGGGGGDGGDGRGGGLGGAGGAREGNGGGGKEKGGSGGVGSAGRGGGGEEGQCEVGPGGSCSNQHHRHGGDEEFAQAVMNSKLESVAYEYTHLLTTQLDSQRLYFEGLLAAAKAERDEAVAAAEAARESVKVQKLQSRLERAEQEKEFLRQVNDSLIKNQKQWQERFKQQEEREKAAVAARDDKIKDLEEQVRDLMVFIEAQKIVEREGGAGTAEGIREGTVVAVGGTPGGGEKGAGRARGRHGKRR